MRLFGASFSFLRGNLILYKKKKQKLIKTTMAFTIVASGLTPSLVVGVDTVKAAEPKAIDSNPASDFTYKVNNGEVTITGYEGVGKSIVFPSTINGMPVVQLGESVGPWVQGSFFDKGITNIVIPNTVKVIGVRAFNNNPITNIDIPSNVTTIEEMAFYENSLKSINLSEGIKTIGKSAFMNNYESKTLKLPNSLETIGDSAFLQSGLAGTLTIPKGIQSMGSEAFARGSLTSVIFEDGITTIGRWAFMGNSLTSIDIPNSVTTIREHAFAHNRLVNVDIPEGINSVEDGVFGANQGLKEVVYKGKSRSTVFGDWNGIYDLNSSVIFKGYTGTSFETAVKSQGFTFQPLVNLEPAIIKNVRWDVNLDKSSAVVSPTIEGDVSIVKYAKGKDLTADFFNNPANNSHIVEVTTNSNYAFTVNEGTDYTIYLEDALGNRVVQTFDPSFIYSTMDNSISIQGYWGSELDVVIPAAIEGLQVTRIAPNAFQPVSESTQLAKGQSTVKLNSVVIPETVTFIGNSAFYKNNLQSITLPQNLKSLEGYAFTGNKLTTVVVPAGVTSLQDGVFLGNRLTSIDIQGNIIQIGADALNGNKLTSFIVPNNVTKIGARAFQSNLLSKVALNNGLISIGADAFSANRIINLVIPTTVKTIDNRAFNQNPLTYVEFKGAEPSTTIGTEAFNTPSAKYYGLKETVFETFIANKGYSYNDFYTMAGYSNQVKKTHSLSIIPTDGNPSDAIYYALNKKANVKDVQSADWFIVPHEGITTLLDETLEDGTYYLHTKIAWGINTLFETSNPLELDNTPPVEPIITVIIDDSKDKALTVAIDFPTDAVGKEYRIDGGTWTPYTAPIVLVKNGKFEARATDTAGNETVSKPLSVDVQAIKLKWLLDNYSTATVDNFVWAGISGVTSENVDLLKGILTNYIATFNGGEVTVPTVSDYEIWLTYIATLTNIQTSIENAKSLDYLGELTTAIQSIKDTINSLPDWVAAKTSFNEQLSLLERFAIALDAVIVAETSLQQGDKDSAKSLVDVIGDAQIQKHLSDRLNIVQEFIVAITFVENAESIRHEKDILEAQAKVTDLPDHKVKIELQNRLDALLHLIGVEEAVAKSESTLVQEDKDKAQTLVDTLPDIPDKDSLQSRLDLVQHIIDATNAVEQAELASSDGNIATAQEKIDFLPTSEKKTELQERLDAVKILNDATKAVVNAETNLTQDDHDKAKQLVDTLSGGTEKENLLSRLNDVQNIISATKAIEDAESTLEKAVVEIAQPLVDIIVNEAKKNELQERLDEVSKTISAKDGVDTAEVSYSKSDKDAAEQLVNALSPDNPHKQELLDRLEQIQIVIDAIEAVETAKTSPTVDNIKTAQDFINKIEEHNPKKAELQLILDGINNLKAIEDAVSRSETSLEQEDVNAARELVDALNNSDIKNVFIERLDEVQRLIEAEKAVSNLEQSLSKDDYEGVKSQVDALKNHPKKDELLDRLEVIKDKIDKLTAEEEAEKAVENAENTLEKDDYDKAKNLVNNLEDEVKKSELQDRLDIVLEKIGAIEAVENAEKTLTQEDKNSAQSKVDKLQDGELKKELQNRLDEVQKKIDNLSAEEKAEKAVEKTESTLDKGDYNIAKDFVNSLEEGIKKDELQNRLDKVKELIDLIREIDKTLKEAEDTLNTDSLSNVQDKINALPDSTIKITLQARLDNLLEYREAENVVSKAEEMKVQSYKDKAQESVDLLKPWKGKDYLQERLDKLQNVIDQKEGDLIDKILNDPDNVTSQELADYTDNDVVDEKLKDYIDNIIEEAEHGNIEKGDVVQIVRLITFLERSKRSMAEEHITKYEAEFLSATVSVKSKFPNPSVLRSIPNYLNDALDLPTLAQELSDLLNRPLEDVLAELEALLGSDEVITLSYLVKYVTEGGDVILEQTKEAPTGTITVNAQALEGYELVYERTQTFELKEDTKGTVITFIVKPVKEVTEITQGSYTIEYVTLENEVVHTETIEEVNFGNIDIVAKAPEGYELLETEEPSQTIELSKDIPFELLRFVVKQKETSIETPPTDDGKESVEKPDAEETTTDETNLETSEVEETPSTPEEIIEETSVETVTAPTIGEETALVRSFLVASLDNAYFTATVQNTGVGHSQYLYDVSQSTVLVRAFLANPTDETRLEAKNFILGNLYAGEFKTTLLKLLALPGEEIPGFDEDITIIHPSKPPVDPNPPVEPPVVIPKPEIPTVLPEIPGGTTVAETVDYNEGKWTIKNPASDIIELKQKDIKIKIPLEIDAKLWEVEWILKANQHYQLRIWADGKEITVFKKPIEITKTSKKVYVFRFENGQYTAIPFTFAVPNQIQFKVTKTGEFQFSTNRITFKDIEGVFSKAAIEELASRYIVNGKTPDYYKPNDSLTRAEFSAMLVRGLGIDISEDYDGVFKDVKEKDWFAKEIQALYSTGIIKGITATKFNPNSPLTRQQAAVMLDRAFEYLKVEKDESEKLDFSDAAKISEEAKPAVAVMNALGIFSGKPGNYFDPHANLTRAEMAKVLQRTLEIIGQF